MKQQGMGRRKEYALDYDVIHEKQICGDDVKIRQGGTLGAWIKREHRRRERRENKRIAENPE